MKRTLLMLCLLGLVGCASGSEEADTTRSVVRHLTDPAKYQWAYDQIISWQRYAGEHKYDEEPDNVACVVICPQPGSNEPMYVVFHGARGELRGGFTLLTSRGELVNFFSGANYMDSGDRIGDLNGDGTVEIAKSWLCGGLEGTPQWTLLVVVPVRPEQKPILSVGYDTRGDHDNWRWSLEEKPHAIRLENRRNGDWRLVARFPWSSAEGRYTGPAGGPGHDFIKFDGYPGWEAFEEFARHNSE